MNNASASWMIGRPMAMLPSFAASMASGLVADKLESGSFSQSNGVAILGVQGVLHNGSYWGGTSYPQLRAGLVAAVQDPKVRAVALAIDSPGGEVAGNFDLADLVYEARSYKPIWAILNESAYSAAYSLASACSKICVPRTGGTGSIGVITEHVDISAALDKAGVKVTTIHYGAQKALGSETEPLDAASKALIQAKIDAMGEMFVATVARNRGLDAKKIKNTEAATFLGEKGVDIGLADVVSSPDIAFLALVNSLK